MCSKKARLLIKIWSLISLFTVVASATGLTADYEAKSANTETAMGQTGPPSITTETAMGQTGPPSITTETAMERTGPPIDTTEAAMEQTGPPSDTTEATMEQIGPPSDATVTTNGQTNPDSDTTEATNSEVHKRSSERDLDNRHGLKYAVVIGALCLASVAVVVAVLPRCRRRRVRYSRLNTEDYARWPLGSSAVRNEADWDIELSNMTARLMKKD